MNEDQDVSCQTCAQIQLWVRRPTALLTLAVNLVLIYEYRVAVFRLLGIL